jgi:hypothetical protein
MALILKTKKNIKKKYRILEELTFNRVKTEKGFDEKLKKYRKQKGITIQNSWTHKYCTFCETYDHTMKLQNTKENDYK